MTNAARWDAELQVKTHVVSVANVWLRDDVKNGYLSKVQYKKVVQGVAHDMAGSAWVNRSWDGDFHAEVLLRIATKKAEVLKECWGKSTLRSAMREIDPALGPADSSGEALQHVFLRINREQVANERVCRAIVDEHVKSRLSCWHAKICGANGVPKKEGVWKEMELMERCVVDRKEALRRRKVIPAHMQNPITLAANANQLGVNEMMKREFERRMKAWWELHKYDDPKRDSDYDPSEEEHERSYNPDTKEFEGKRTPLDPLWSWRP